LTTGVHKLGQGVHWGSLTGFSGDDPGLPRFDRGLTGLTRLIRSLALMTVIKNLGRHSLPPLRRISSRDSKLQGEVINDSGIEVLPMKFSWLCSTCGLGLLLLIADPGFCFCCWGFCCLGFGHLLAKCPGCLQL
jgi:hypothetical protein